MRVNALSIGYHDVLEQETHSLPADVLRYCLARRDFREHLSAIRWRSPGPIEPVRSPHVWLQENPLFLTFDDGGKGSYTCVVDELERYGWRGHFFITTDWIGKTDFMNAREIREIHARGHVIGSHSCSHPARMSRLAMKDLMTEWGESCARLADIIGCPVNVASLPDGYYHKRVAQAAAAVGIEALFTSEPRTRVDNVNDCLVLGRYTILRGMPPQISGALAAGERGPRWRQVAAWEIKKAVKRVAGRHYLTTRQFLLEQCLRSSIS